MLAFLPQLLNLFGCTDALREDALNYGYIIAIGLPFTMIGTTLNSIIRADGNPRYAMTSMLTGAILNIILDPIFIFVFKMGVQGAAIATVISQFITFIINVLYIKKFKSVKIQKQDFKPRFNLIGQVAMLGISSFINQMSFVVVMGVENNLLAKYGAESKFGSEIPITVFGIVMKISQILNSIIIGIAVGAQPIFGYNYGAQKFDRVKKALKTVLGLSVIVSTVAFILFQTIPDKLILLFGSGDANYMEFACIAFRTYLLLCICNGIQIPSGIFFQAIGKGVKSAILSLSRQIVLLIPSMIILSSTFGIIGFLYAGPVADGLAFVLAVILLTVEVRHLKKANSVSQTLIDDTSTDNKLEKQVVITISREYGSGGRYVGRLIADKLGIKLYDKEILKKYFFSNFIEKDFKNDNIPENIQCDFGLIPFTDDSYYPIDYMVIPIFDEIGNLAGTKLRITRACQYNNKYFYKKQHCDHKCRCFHDPQTSCIYIRKAVFSNNGVYHFSELIYDHKTTDTGCKEYDKHRNIVIHQLLRIIFTCQFQCIRQRSRCQNSCTEHKIQQIFCK